MKKIILFVFLLAVSVQFIEAQELGPQILVLTPNEFVFEDGFKKKIADRNNLLKTYKNDFNNDDIISQPKNIQRSLISQTEYSKELNFNKSLSLVAHQYLFYKFYEKFKNFEIILSKDKIDGNISDFENFENSKELQFILNFQKINLYQKEEIDYSKIRVQLFDLKTKTFLVNEDFIGDWSNPGFEFACEDKSLDCCINNALSKALKLVFQKIYFNTPFIIEQQKLAKERYDILMNRFYINPSDLTFLNEIITENDSSISLSSLYQIEIDKSESKFVGFFIEEVISNDFKSLKEKNNDKSIQILRTDNDSFNDIPKMYAYALKGVLYKEKWYYEKFNATYFDAKNLIDAKQDYYFNISKWNYFQDNSTNFNENFWETNLFSKVNNSDNDYYGLYHIVEKNIKKEKRAENENLNQNFSKNVLIPFYDNQVRTLKNSFSDYKLMYDKPTLIYPKERDYILTPILVSNKKGEKEIHYYLIITKDNSIYEWTYFEPENMPENTWHYGSKVVSQLKKITNWTFGYATLDDELFWNKYVLKTENNSYKYLRKMN